MKPQIAPTYELAFDFAYRFFPERVLEKRKIAFFIEFLMCVALVIPLYLLTPPHLKTLLALFAASFHIFGWIFDTYTTHHSIQLGSWFEAQGYQRPFIEANPFLPDAPTLKDLLTSGNTIIEAIVLIILLFFPPFSLAFFVGHTSAAINNYKNEKRARFMKDILMGEKRLVVS